MKKLVVLLLSLVLVFALAACGEEKVITRDSGDTTASDALVFEYNGVQVPILAEAEDVMAKLGDPVSKYEAPSCAFGELDTTYTYQGVEIGTYQQDGVEYISYVLLKDDTVETPEGLYLGADLAKVQSIYGDPTSKTDTSFTYLKSNMKLVVIFDDSGVTSIEYLNIVLD